MRVATEGMMGERVGVMEGHGIGIEQRSDRETAEKGIETGMDVGGIGAGIRDMTERGSQTAICTTKGDIVRETTATTTTATITNATTTTTTTTTIEANGPTKCQMAGGVAGTGVKETAPQ